MVRHSKKPKNCLVCGENIQQPPIGRTRRWCDKCVHKIKKERDLKRMKAQSRLKKMLKEGDYDRIIWLYDNTALYDLNSDLPGIESITDSEKKSWSESQIKELIRKEIAAMLKLIKKELFI